MAQAILNNCSKFFKNPDERSVTTVCFFMVFAAIAKIQAMIREGCEISMPASIQKSSDLPICFSTEQKTSLWFVKDQGEDKCIVEKFIVDDYKEKLLFKVVETKLYQSDCGNSCCRYYIKMSADVKYFRFKVGSFDRYRSLIHMSLDLQISIDAVGQIVKSVDLDAYTRLKTIQDFHDNAWKTMCERSGESISLSV